MATATTLDFSLLLTQWPFLLKGVAWTLGLTAIAMALGLVVGIACAWARTTHARGLLWLRALTGAYVELIRNTPFIVQLFFIFFGLPSAGLRLSPEAASILAMVLNLGAYSAEIIRAGVQATPRGQIEAALSLALNRWQVYTRVVLPPALQRVWPALVSQIIIVMLGSAVCGQISTEELSYAANVISAASFRTFEAYIVVTAVYLLLAIALRRLLHWAGPRFIFGR
ncbi:ABC transporter permease [Hylemonella gracilis str. Niagara R]|uniref:ABC transporter permease n=1 Tax=Hylemonella gracilis str. Niagara R TaxID=1458275 RepID=A0A016XHD1_9BURK|nr:amino acid ABC transporter permease [Hylemonella gracilis]EYC50588.1 ABC transporter permease [Hylemonella gracilis str. Niagara R]